MGANDAQTVKAFLEAESYDGPSLIIAYCHCIAHGIDMTTGMQQPEGGGAERRTGRCTAYDPRLAAQGKNPLILDSKAPSIPIKDYAYMETRYKMLTLSQPEEAKRLLELAQQDAHARYKFYQQLAATEIRRGGREGRSGPNDPAGVTKYGRLSL